MPKKIDPELGSLAVRLVIEHRGQYASLTAAAATAAKQLGVGQESVRRWVVQADVDTGGRDGVTTQELEEIRKLKAENRPLREDVAILKAARRLSSRGTRPPQPLIMGFIDTLRSEGHAARVDLSGPGGAGLPGCGTNLSGLANGAAGCQGDQRCVRRGRGPLRSLDR